MVTVRVVRGTVVGGLERFPGDVIEVTPTEARVLVDLHRQAERVAEDAPVMGLEHRDTVSSPAKRGRR